LENANTPAHPSYSKLNQVFDECGFDAYVEEICAPFYRDFGRPGITPGVYFLMIFIGYFEGLSGQRGTHGDVMTACACATFSASV